MVLNTKVAGRLAELPVDLGSVVRRRATSWRSSTSSTSGCASSRRARRSRRRGPGSACRSTATKDTIDAGADRARAPGARACWSRRTRQRDRMAALHRDGILSKAELDQAEADFRFAEARLQEALEEVRNRQALVAERRAALAPRRAGAGRRHVARAVRRRGARAPPVDRRLSATSARRSPPSCASIRCACGWRCPSARPASVRVGQRSGCVSTGATPPSKGTVVRLSPAVDEDTRTLLVEAEVPNDDGALRPGTFASAEIVVEPEQPAVLVPASALVTFAGVDKVLGVDDGRVVEQRVRIGRRVGDRVEVLDGPRRRRRRRRRAREPDRRARPSWRSERDAEARRDLHPPPGLRGDAHPGAGGGRRRGATCGSASTASRPSTCRTVRVRADAARRLARGDRDRGHPAHRGGGQHRRGHQRAALDLRRRAQSFVDRTFDLDRDIDVAAQDVRDRVSAVLRDLPRDIDPPVVAKFDNDSQPGADDRAVRPTARCAS